MYNLLISLAAGLVTTIIFGLIFGQGAWSIVYGIVPGVLVLLGVYIWLARRSLKQIQALGEAAQTQLQGRNIDGAVEIFKQGYPVGKWQFLVKPQLDAQIGTIYFVAQRFDEAEPYLKGAFAKNWTARAMLGVLYYKRRKFDEMEQVFENAAAANKKEALFWNVYAYCLWKSKQRDKAIDVLNRAVDALDGHEVTEKNLAALKNNRKMKMRSWNQLWYQFHLDRMPAQRQRIQYR
jgi:tetratricopeptide (TPR) repeat protein